MRRSFSIVVVGSMVALAAPRAGAQGNPDAARLFKEGRVLFEEGKHAEACERFARSFELERGAGTMLNLGDCAERSGELRRAWQLYDAAAREYDQAGKDGPAQFARGRADALAPKLATVVVRIAEPRAEGLTVRIGGRVVPPAPEIVERLDAGAVSIEVGATGREPFSATASATIGAQAVVEVPALRAMDLGGLAPPPTPSPPIDRPTGTRRARGRVWIAAGVAGTGAIALGAAGLLGLRARSAYRAYEALQVELGCTRTCGPDSARLLGEAFDRAALRADLATGFAIGGAALIAGGAVLYLTAPRERVTVAPIASPGAVGLAAAVRF